MKWISWLWPYQEIKAVLQETFKCLEKLMASGKYSDIVLLMVGFIGCFFVYTPIHELFHVFATWGTGGEVRELALDPMYGGTILAKIFPFVVPESDYAGQLTGFSVPNYWAYALVDWAPYILSLPGLWILTRTTAGGKTLLAGAGFMLTFVPITQFSGDFYEFWSLITTQILEARRPGLEAGAFIADDGFKVAGELWENGQFFALEGLLWFTNITLGLYAALWFLSVQNKVRHLLDKLKSKGSTKSNQINTKQTA